MEIICCFSSSYFYWFMNFHNLLFVFREISSRPGTTWNRGVLRRLFRGFPLDEMNARLALEFPERAAIQASIKEYVLSPSRSLSVSFSLPLLLAPFVSCEIPQALAKVQISASCFCFCFFFSLFLSTQNANGENVSQIDTFCLSFDSGCPINDIV